MDKALCIRHELLFLLIFVSHPIPHLLSAEVFDASTDWKLLSLYHNSTQHVKPQCRIPLGYHRSLQIRTRNLSRSVLMLWCRGCP
jgi:hypothetical protein